MSQPVNGTRIQLLTFDGCPLADAAREALDKAVAESGVEGYQEIDILKPDTLEDLRNWGSPTILVNGADVMGSAVGEGACCRIYATGSRVPETPLIVERIREAHSNS